MASDINYTEVSLYQSWESGMGKSYGVYSTFCMFDNFDIFCKCISGIHISSEFQIVWIKIKPLDLGPNCSAVDKVVTSREPLAGKSLF